MEFLGRYLDKLLASFCLDRSRGQFGKRAIRLGETEVVCVSSDQFGRLFNVTPNLESSLRTTLSSAQNEAGLPIASARGKVKASQVPSQVDVPERPHTRLSNHVNSSWGTATYRT